MADAPQRPHCRHCGTPNLHWRKTATRWTLHDDAGKLHQCARREMTPPLDYTSMKPRQPKTGRTP